MPLEKMKVIFNDAKHQKPDDVFPRKKRELQRLVVCGQKNGERRLFVSSWTFRTVGR